MVVVDIDKRKVRAFLKYVYQMEKFAQEEGYSTGDYYNGSVDSIFDKLQKVSRGK